MSSVLLQWKANTGIHWHNLAISGIPVSRPIRMRLEYFRSALQPQVDGLVEKLKALCHDFGGTFRQTINEPLAPATAEDNILEILVGDGIHPVGSNARVHAALAAPIRHWVLPVLPKGGGMSPFAKELQAQNALFWESSLDELALPILARAGVTSLDRRVFISYRRVETTPIALQLFDGLSEQNFEVFLDTVSIDPGVNFQSRLFEQLADKSMVVLLLSETFSASKWTMEEVNYVRDHDLTLLVLRLPSVPPNDSLLKTVGSGETLTLEDGDLTHPSHLGPLYELNPAALHTVLQSILEVHDAAMISRLVQMRQRTEEALGMRQIAYKLLPNGSIVEVGNSPRGKSFYFFPTSRPPGVPELFEASNFNTASPNERMVIGNTASFLQERLDQLEWVVKGRNLRWIDISIFGTYAGTI